MALTTQPADAPLEPHPAPNYRIWATLAMILIVATAVRGYGLGERSLWTDDFFSLITSSGHGNPPRFVEGFVNPPPRAIDLRFAEPWQQIWKKQGLDVHPPVYFIVLRAWRVMFGDSESAVRSLAVVCSVGSIAALFFAARMSFGPSVALWACAMVAVAYQHVLIAREVRHYSMLVLWAMLAMVALLRIQQRGATWLNILSLTALIWLMAETHYFFVGAAVAMAGYAAVFFRGGTRRAVMGAFAVAGVCFMFTAGPYFIDQYYLLSKTTIWLAEPEQGHTWLTLRRLLSQPATLLTWPPRPLRGFLPLTGIVLIVPVLLFRRNRTTVLWWLLLVLVLGIVSISDFTRSTRQLDLPRYTVLAIPPIAVLIAAVAAPWKALRHVLPGAVVLASLWTLPTLYASHTSAFADRHRETAEALAGQVQPGDAIVFATHPERQWYAHILAACYDYYGHPSEQNPTALAYVPGQPALPESLKRFDRVWVVAPSNIDTSTFIPGTAVRSTYTFGEFATLRLLEPR